MSLLAVLVAFCGALLTSTQSTLNKCAGGYFAKNNICMENQAGSYPSQTLAITGQGNVQSRCAIAGAHDLNRIVYSIGSKIYVTDNSGITSSAQDSSPTSSFNSFWTSPDFTKMLAAPTNGPIYMSTNSGNTWTATSSLTTTTWHSVVATPDLTRIIASNKEPVAPSLFDSIDGGLNWRPVVSNFQQHIHTMAATSDLLSIIATVTQYTTPTKSLLYKSLNGGYSWQSIPNSGLQYWKGVATSPCFTKYLATAYDISSTTATAGLIYKSVDAGVTWSVLSASKSLSKNFCNIIADPSHTRITVAMALLSGATDEPFVQSVDSGNSFIFSGNLDGVNARNGGATGLTACRAGSYSSAGARECSLCAK